MGAKCPAPGHPARTTGLSGRPPDACPGTRGSGLPGSWAPWPDARGSFTARAPGRLPRVRGPGP
ncbi:hypothetical protein CP967_02995 [Streptomyces nitrosporeus]|uniref:Uncharacterized protein n=1 Tax=Streptomyces nitrosporeus TaxID=28894 RepID=A0A5J6F7P4_9ACTN|nr:hypothetical protein CP967_02995 [Streptomyces nitrosporeus]GGZ14802.1 hypothetical protein GCM10010327_52160 [Streptomyces nitrosporeus]